MSEKANDSGVSLSYKPESDVGQVLPEFIKIEAGSATKDQQHQNDHDIFIGNLSLYTTNERLKEFLEQNFGKVQEVRIVFDPDTMRSRRFGFATFEDKSTAKTVIDCGEKLLDGRRLEFRSAHKKADGLPGPRSEKIFVGGISQNLSQEHLREYFSKFGSIKDCKLLPDETTGRHRGFAFITFEDLCSAQQACISRFHVINNKRVEVNCANERTEQKKLRGHPLKILANGEPSNRVLHTIVSDPVPSSASNQPLQFSAGCGGKIVSTPAPPKVRYTPYPMATPTSITSFMPPATLLPPPPTPIPQPLMFHPSFYDPNYPLHNLMWAPPTGYPTTITLAPEMTPVPWPGYLYYPGAFNDNSSFGK